MRGRDRYIDDVVSLALDDTLCTGCGICANVCPHGVIAVESGSARLVDRDACIECGACARNCAWGAVTVSPGVGCAAAVIQGWLTRGEPSCDPGKCC